MRILAYHVTATVSDVAAAVEATAEHADDDESPLRIQRIQVVACCIEACIAYSNNTNHSI